MKRSTFIKKVLLLNASLCLGFNLLSCAEEDFVPVHGNGISESELSNLRNLLLANGTIYVTSPTKHGEARKNVKIVRVELDPKLVENKTKKTFRPLARTNLDIIAALIFKKEVNVDVLVNRGFGHLFELVSDDIVMISYKTPSSLSRPLGRGQTIYYISDKDLNENKNIHINELNVQS
ncbi:hypothetical protein MKS83_05675 [Chryseobacterium sp. Y16C]|uniref:hypothetical protein n=1 Tax=Chryseobacterium sp. Y16C TaxID=2920939 RepID=UPI001F0AAABD|nr:hypothetical protein [Chryseobacterium sp. Y16C]UMQ43179.1 hypothetical protein MKS83_05675 [Chryseobacterium sp. Y16C]